MGQGLILAFQGLRQALPQVARPGQVAQVDAVAGGFVGVGGANAAFRCADPSATAP